MVLRSRRVAVAAVDAEAVVRKVLGSRRIVVVADIVGAVEAGCLTALTRGLLMGSSVQVVGCCFLGRKDGFGPPKGCC